MNGIATQVGSLAAQITTLAAQDTSQNAQLASLTAQVTSLQTTVSGLQTSGGVTRTVISGFIDLNGPGDIVVDFVGSDNIRRVRHIATFDVPGLTPDDPPAITLLHKRRTDAPGGQPPALSTTAFAVDNLLGMPPNQAGGFGSFLDPTSIAIDNGQIRLTFRFEAFNPATAPTPIVVRYGLDGPGGTGEFRLVLVQ